MTAKYTGHVRKGAERGTIVGELLDEWGWMISFVGTLGDGGVYSVKGVAGEIPEGLRFPFEDREDHR